MAEAATEVVVIEAIKLLEAGLSVHLCDEVWVVTAPRAAQLARLTASRGLSEAEAVLRIDAQPAQALKIAQADVVIENDGDLETLRIRVQRQWRSLAGSRPAHWALSVEIVRLENLMNRLQTLYDRHPSLTMWAALAVGMVIILLVAARSVGFTAPQWAALIVATVALAGLCAWIIGWEDKE